MVGLRLLTCVVACLYAFPSQADLLSVSYTPMTQGELTDLTTWTFPGGNNIDWVKWGGSGESGLSFSVIEKVGGTIIDPTLTMIDPTPPGAPTVVPAAFSGDSTLTFDWSDGSPTASGTSVDTVVSQTMTPAQNSYPIGIGQSFNVQASSDLRILDVFVQGFDSDMQLMASLSGGDNASIIVPIDDPSTIPIGNEFFSVGRFRVIYSGLGETLTVSTSTVNDASRMGDFSQFANAGMFAAVVSTPEPSSLSLLTLGGALFVFVQRRTRRAAGSKEQASIKSACA